MNNQVYSRKKWRRVFTRVFREQVLSRRVLIVTSTALVGLILLQLSHAGVNSFSIQPEAATREGNVSAEEENGVSFVRFGNAQTCGKRVSNYTYNERPFGPLAAWNVPICSLPEISKSNRWVSNLWNYAGPNHASGEWKTSFGLIDPAKPAPGSDYSIPVYDAKDATMQVRVRRKAAFGGRVSIATVKPSDVDDTTHSNATMPFNPNWRPADGKDAHMVIIDHTNGKEWDIWNPSWWSFSTPDNMSASCYPLGGNGVNLEPPFGIGFNDQKDICAGLALLVKDPAYNVVDVRSYQGNSPNSTGIGIPMSFGLVTPDEVAAGEIRHALKFGYRNKGFGPECPANTSYDDPSFGVTCSSAMAPAGQFEGVADVTGQDSVNGPLAPGSTPNEIRSNTVPQGSRFALHITDDQIKTWLDSRGYSGTKRETARKIAVALRDYGWINSITSGGTASFYMEGAANNSTGDKWRDLGIDKDGSDLLYGLFSESNMYAVKPPKNRCNNDQLSNFYCFASDTQYPTNY